MLLADILFYYSSQGKTEIGYAKNWKGHDVSRLIRCDTITP